MSHGTLDVDPYPTGAFALAVGTYLAVVLVPAAALAAGSVQLPLWILFVVTTVAVAVPASRREGWLADRLGTDRRAWALAALPLSFGAVFPWSPDGTATGLALAGLLAGLVAGVVVVVMASTRAVEQRAGGAPVRAAWRARASPGWRRRYRRGAVVCAVGGLAAMLVGALLDVEAALTVGQVVFPIAGGLYGSTRNRNRYAVVDAGLVQRAPVTARLLAWREFDAVDATDDAVVLRARRWWVPDRRWDRGDLDDPEAVVAALRERVDRPTDPTAR
jgi:hypothetical protein